MTDAPWSGDACSLVDAYRAGELTPVEELEATLAAIDGSDLNAFCHVDADAAIEQARRADLTLPFGGVPVGVKELQAVAGWPYTEASVPLADRVATQSATMVERLVGAGAVLAGQTTSSEFGGVNLTRTVLHGTTRNPWHRDRTPGGSSGGSSAAVAGGLVPIATGGDGGGSIRIPAGFCGLVGLKATYGRIPRGPGLELGNLTAVAGCLARSVRDTARFFDVVGGHHPTDPLSLPPTEPWEPRLGTRDVSGLRVAVVPDWGGAVVASEPWSVVEEAAGLLTEELGWRRIDIDTALPRVGAAWSLSGVVGIFAALGDAWPDCADDLTPEMRSGLRSAEGRYGLEARIRIEQRRTALNEAMARIFSEVDLVLTASNPEVAFAADGPLPDTFGGVETGADNNGRLTFPANLHGNPAVSIPVGTVGGLPVGLQVVGRHFTEPQLLDVALAIERTRPWPMTAGSPTEAPLEARRD